MCETPSLYPKYTSIHCILKPHWAPTTPQNNLIRIIERWDSSISIREISMCLQYVMRCYAQGNLCGRSRGGLTGLEVRKQKPIEVKWLVEDHKQMLQNFLTGCPCCLKTMFLVIFLIVLIILKFFKEVTSRKQFIFMKGLLHAYKIEKP